MAIVTTTMMMMKQCHSKTEWFKQRTRGGGHERSKPKCGHQSKNTNHNIAITMATTFAIVITACVAVVAAMLAASLFTHSSTSDMGDKVQLHVCVPLAVPAIHTAALPCCPQKKHRSCFRPPWQPFVSLTTQLTWSIPAVPLLLVEALHHSSHRQRTSSQRMCSFKSTTVLSPSMMHSLLVAI